MTSLQGLDDPARIPGATAAFEQYVSNIRMYMRDHAALNRLIEGQETNDRMIAWSIMDAMSDFNGTPPLIGALGFEDFMRYNLQSLLRTGTVIKILESVGLLQTRNHLPFSDGGLNVAVSDKTPLIQSWIQLFSARWETDKKQVKIGMNIESLLDGTAGVVSEYFSVSGWYADALSYP